MQFNGKKMHRPTGDHIKLLTFNIQHYRGSIYHL